MIFEHCNHLGDLELEKKETPGCRLYHLPDGQWVPSITSVTSFYNRDIFIKWRKRIGIEEANKSNIAKEILTHFKNPAVRNTVPSQCGWNEVVTINPFRELIAKFDTGNSIKSVIHAEDVKVNLAALSALKSISLTVPKSMAV